MRSKLLFFAFGVILLSSFHFSNFTGFLFEADIPKTWDPDSLRDFHLPLVDTAIRIDFVPEEFYYQFSERKIYKSYPFYIKGAEPENYWEWLLEQEPEIAFDPGALQTREDWIRAGELAYEAPLRTIQVTPDFAKTVENVADATGMPVAKDGHFPYFSYIIREKGKVEVGMFSCAMCHNRVMPEGSIIKGGQGTFNLDRMDGRGGFFSAQQFLNFRAQLYDAPWVDSTKNAFRQLTAQEILKELQNMPTGVMMRHGSAPLYPTAIPSLIGIKDIKYLDHTGLMLHRGPGDLMRYGALNQGMDMFNSYGGYIPSGENNNTELPPVGTANPAGATTRYSEEQLYAITQYLYSLEPPENPNHFDQELLDRGEQIFIEEGCVTCHTPPLYTNNMLTPVDGFEPPAAHFEKYDIFNVSVETDPGLALYTRRATGYYKIPSLRGLWYRGPYGHSGEFATLEDWFDPKRLEEDYLPTGYKPVGLETKAVKGHDFGLTLDPSDKEALIAFLKSL